jgi:S1-C subfamily serine protease
MNLPEDTTGALVYAVTSVAGPPQWPQRLSDEATIQGSQIGIGGDLITAIDSQPVKSFDDLVSYLTPMSNRSDSTLQVLRMANDQRGCDPRSRPTDRQRRKPVQFKQPTVADTWASPARPWRRRLPIA